jgi:hypothetical protein
MTRENLFTHSRRGFLANWGRRMLLAVLAGLTWRLAARRPRDCGQPPTLACEQCASEVRCPLRQQRRNELQQRGSAERT